MVPRREGGGEGVQVHTAGTVTAQPTLVATLYKDAGWCLFIIV